MKYVIDSSALIFSARHFYPPPQFEELWNYLISLTKTGEVIILKRVRDELLKGDDYLKKEFATKVEVTDEEIPEVYNKLSDIANVFPPKDQVAVARWSQKGQADPFIIAYALFLKENNEPCCVIQGENDNIGKVRIPTACNKLDIEHGHLNKLILNKKIKFNMTFE